MAVVTITLGALVDLEWVPDTKLFVYLGLNQSQCSKHRFVPTLQPCSTGMDWRVDMQSALSVSYPLVCILGKVLSSGSHRILPSRLTPPLMRPIRFTPCHPPRGKSSDRFWGTWNLLRACGARACALDGPPTTFGCDLRSFSVDPTPSASLVNDPQLWPSPDV